MIMRIAKFISRNITRKSGFVLGGLGICVVEPACMYDTQSRYPKLVPVP